MDKKLCKMCGIEHDATTEFFYRCKKSKDGLFNICKSCKRQVDRQYKDENRDKLSIWRKQFRQNNKEKVAQWHREYRQQNRETIASYTKKYQQENRERLNANRKRLNALKPETPERRRRRYDSDKENSRIRTQQYNARKRKLPATLTKKEWEYCKSYFEHKCAYCGSDKNLEREHFIALSNGGGFTKENIVPSCKRCNCSKGQRDFFKWYPEHISYSEERENKILLYLNIEQRKVVS